MPGISIHRGHSSEEVDTSPRVIATITSGSGTLLRGAGVDELELSIQILTSAAPSSDPGDPIQVLATISDDIRAALDLDNLATLKSALNKPSTGPDTRLVQGFGLTGLEYAGHKEGRDPERALHGIILSYLAWAQLE